jgi:hypothetical protein
MIKTCARGELEAGVAALKQGQGEEALARAKTSWGLRKSPPAAKLAFLACILLKRFDEAAMWYNYGTGPPG